MMRKVFLFVAAAASILACSCGTKGSSDNQQTKSDSTTASIVEVSIDSLISNPQAFANQTVKFTAKVDHVCMHSGQKLTLMGSDSGSTFKVMATDAVPQFDQNLNGTTVEVVGVVQGAAAEDVESCNEGEGGQQEAKKLDYAVFCQKVRAL